MDVTSVLSGICLYDMRSLFFIPLFTVDKDDKAGNGLIVPVSMKDNGQSDQSWIQSSCHAIATLTENTEARRRCAMFCQTKNFLLLMVFLVR